MKLWYVSQDGERRLYTDPRTGTSKLIGARLLYRPEVEQVELVDQIGAIHWWHWKR